MNVLETLKCVRKVLDKPEAWTQGAYARAVDGMGTRAGSPDATRFCLIGAARKCTDRRSDDAEEVLAFAKVLKDALGSEVSEPVAAVLCFNDFPATSHKQVLEILDAAIARQGDKA